MQQEMDEHFNDTYEQDEYYDEDELQAEINESIETKDQNLGDALENMKMLQEIALEQKHMERGGTMMDQSADIHVEPLDENLLTKLKDFDVKKLKTKRFAEMIHQERVVMTLYMIIFMSVFLKFRKTHRTTHLR